ncbi:BON domain-containing protein [Planctomyces sp. SH-PL62]|uniref:BON domain-containing protein n=1 Tax=Planctomyces sp. SH-PL62 TaxID=1636152 RepID=UPI00078E428F|nr:BON domain-containing protein [Planctomyces sp. SH-PL62]AMV40277.1 periplasmic protein [Planctomyces sp. SH-PL62]
MNSFKRFGMAAALGAGLVAGGMVVRAQQEPGPIERAGEKLDEAGRSLRQGLERGFNRTKEAVRETFETTRAKVNDMSIEARVYGRLHWDKQLETSAFELSSEAQGIVTLRGSVPSVEAKKHAVDLAAETVGVTRVVDQLAVQTATQATEVEVRTKTVTPAPAERVRPRVKATAPVTSPQD